MNGKDKSVVRIVNPRFPVFVALTVIALSLGFSYAAAGSWLAWLAFGAAAVLVVFAILRCKTDHGRLIFAIVAVLCACVVGVGTHERVEQWQTAPIFTDPTTIVCTIDTAPSFDGDGYVFRATGLRLHGEQLALDAEVRVTTDQNYWEQVKVGRQIRLMQVTLTKEDALADGKVDHALLGTPYRIEVKEGYALLGPTASVGLFDAVRYRIVNVVRQRFSPAMSGVALALVIGDKSLLPDTVYSSFKLAGIAHALAVSGLHVGFLLAIIGWLTRRLYGKGRAVGFGITVLVLAFYMTLCGFTAGVVRACVTGMLSALATLLGKRSDPLINLGLAAWVMLCVDPTLVTDLGFGLSFSSVVGIILLMPPLTRLLRRLRFPEWLATGVAVTTASSVAVLPIIAAYFHTLSAWSVVENLIAAPFISVVFTVLTVCVTLAAITGVVYFLDPAGLLLTGLRVFTDVCTLLPGSDLIVFSLGIGIPFFVVAVVFCGELVLIRSARLRRAVTVVMACLLVVLVAVSNIPRAIRSEQACVVGTSSVATAAVVTPDATVVVGRMTQYTEPRVEDALVASRIRRVDVLVVTGGSVADVTAVRQFVRRFGVRQVLIDAASEEDTAASDLAWALGSRALVLLHEPMTASGVTFTSGLESANVAFRLGTTTYLYAEDGEYPATAVDVVLSRDATHASAGAVSIVAQAEGTQRAVAVSNGVFITVA